MISYLCFHSLGIEDGQAHAPGFFYLNTGHPNPGPHASFKVLCGQSHLPSPPRVEHFNREEQRSTQEGIKACGIGLEVML